MRPSVPLIASRAARAQRKLRHQGGADNDTRIQLERDEVGMIKNERTKDGKLFGVSLSKFMSRVKKTDSCWIWTGRRQDNGKPRQDYGRFDIENGCVMAHKISYEHFVGPVPNHLKVLHRCDNPPCVNPSHLWLGTQKDNMRDCVAKGRNPKGYKRKSGFQRPIGPDGRFISRSSRLG